uniref:Uncharacterized protein n=1 Tax=Triticum urartu TaxID=4572 RepID=A0A8R7V2K4_TRIUA
MPCNRRPSTKSTGSTDTGSCTTVKEADPPLVLDPSSNTEVFLRRPVRTSLPQPRSASKAAGSARMARGTATTYPQCDLLPPHELNPSPNYSLRQPTLHGFPRQPSHQFASARARAVLPAGRAVHLARPYETVVTFSLRRGEEIRRSPTVVEAVATTRVNNSEIPPLGCTAVQFWWAPLSSDRRVCSAVRWRGSHHWTPAVLFPSR